MDDDDLALFVLRDVLGLDLGEKIGSGAYGAVYEVTVKGVPCLVKRLHDILVDRRVSERERESIQKKFRQECVTLSKLKHPNIVHFVGVHYGRAPGDVSLIMEKLHTDLGEYLDTKPNIPLSIKLSILLDVSYGLLYLHTLSPKPIIHRDLTASNILLTSDMRAKIADLGVSKMLDLRAQVARTQTKAPGALYYMPPEALSVSTQYGVELDVFSFGHLALYTITQAPPEPDDSKVTPTAVEHREMQLAKREASIEKMGRDHCLCPLIMQCLQDRPERRPSTSDLNQAVKELSVRDPVDLTHEEDENRKLMEDLQGANKDLWYLKEALAAVTASREELITQIQLLNAQMDDLGPKEESARQQLKSLRDSYRTMQQQCQEMKAENQGLLKQMEKLHTLSEKNVRDQQDQFFSSLRTLKADLINDLEAARTEALIYKEGFEKERQDRAKMDEQCEHHAKEMKEKTSLVDRVQIENQKLIEQLKKLRMRVDEQKDELQVAKAETVLYKEDSERERQERIISFGKIDEKQQQLKEVELMAQTKETAARRIGQNLDVAQQDLARAQEEVRAKTSQVKQYKKQVDQLKAQLTYLEGQNFRLIETMEGVRKELEKTKGSTKLPQKLAIRKKKPDRSLASPEQPMSMPLLQTESTLSKAKSQYEKERDKNDDVGRRSATASPLNSPMEDHPNSPQSVQEQSMPQMVGHLGAEHQDLHVHATSDSHSTEV